MPSRERKVIMLPIVLGENKEVYEREREKKFVLVLIYKYF
jgi:hypothetical protein